MSIQLFSYWEGKKPAYIEMCEESITKNNPGFMVLGLEDLPRVMPEYASVWGSPFFNAMVPAHRADVVRALYLRPGGAAWIDLDFVCFHSLDPLMGVAEREGKFLYYNDSWGPTNGFLIAPAGHLMAREYADKVLTVYKNMEATQVPTKIPWTGMGADQLKACLAEALAPHADLKSSRVQLIAWEHRHKFFEQAPPAELKLRVWPQAYGYMLYNNSFTPAFKGRTRAEILAEPTVIGEIFRTALGA